MSILAIVQGITHLAPMVAGWLGGDKAEEAAEKVIDVARAVTGLDDPKSAADAISTDPALAAKFREQLEANRHEMDKLYLADKQNARDMQNQTLLNGRSRVSREFVYWYAGGLTFAAVAYIGAITFIPIPVENVRFADTALGFILGTVLGSIIQFFYGASKPVREDD